MELPPDGNGKEGKRGLGGTSEGNPNDKRLKVGDEKLAIDLMVEILSRIPVQDALRCRCLNKFYKGLISSNIFTQNHLQRTLVEEGDTKIHFLLHNKNRLGNEFYLIPRQSFNQFLKLDVSYMNLGPDQELKILGSSNGVIFLVSRGVPSPFSQNLYLWNPATRAWKNLPPFSIPNSETKLGFGTNSGFSELKVVRLVHFKGSKDHAVEVYSVSRGSWKVIGCISYCFSTVVCRDTVNGCIHFQAAGPSAFRSKPPNDFRNSFVLAFDVDKEVFNEIPLPQDMNILDPNDLDTTQIQELKLMSLRGQLSVASEVGSLTATADFNTRIDVWVMKVYGVQESWSKLFTLQRGGFGVGLVSLLRDRGSLLYMSSWPGLETYDFLEETGDDVVIPDLIVGGFSGVSYVESLVPIEPAPDG